MRCAVLPGAHVTIRDLKTGIVTVFKINKNRSINKKVIKNRVATVTFSVFIKTDQFSKLNHTNFIKNHKNQTDLIGF
jgi:hypothetical protein